MKTVSKEKNIKKTPEIKRTRFIEHPVNIKADGFIDLHRDLLLLPATSVRKRCFITPVLNPPPPSQAPPPHQTDTWWWASVKAETLCTYVRKTTCCSSPGTTIAGNTHTIVSGSVPTPECLRKEATDGSGAS